MTTTSSAWSATTPRSWVISSTAVPVVFRSSSSRARIWACTVTSSAVVGSSAISTRGRQARAMAIITRCRIPPESWCGYWRARRAASGMRTASSISTARAMAAARSRSWCSRSASATCSPAVKAGFRLVMGSWKTIASSRPRRRRRSSGGNSAISRPAKRTAPLVVAPGGNRPMMASDVADLPHPLSPTRATVRPAGSAKEIPSSTRKGPRSVAKLRARSTTSSAGAVMSRRTPPPPPGRRPR